MQPRVLLVIEVRSVAFVTETIWSIACLAAREVRAVGRGQAPKATAAAILHEVWLPEHKSHFILVCRAKVWQMIVGYGSTVRIASVPQGQNQAAPPTLCTSCYETADD